MANETVKTRHVFLSEVEPFAPEGPEARARADLSVALVGPPGPPKAAAGKEADPGPLRLVRLDAETPRTGDDVCLDEDGNRAGGSVPVACPSAPLHRFHLGQQLALSARTADGILLAGVDTWYRQGQHGAGFCPTCEMALIESIRRSYGEHVQPFRVLDALRAPGQPSRQRPFWGLRESLRLGEPLTATRAVILRARDEARKVRNLELPVFVRTGPLNALALSLAPHVDGLVFQTPWTDPLHGLLPLLAARAAMKERPAVALLPAESTPAQVRVQCALASACDVDVMLEAGASAEARKVLVDDRRYRTVLRERSRATQPLADVEIYLSPRADHFCEGQHLAITTAAVAALASANLQLGLGLERVPERSTQGDAALLVLAGAAELPQDLGPPLRKFVEAGGDLLLVGPCTLIDEEGRPQRPLFPEAKAGLERLGEGRLWTIVTNAQGELPQGAALEALVLRAARELMGRRRPLLALTGRGRLWARAYLDPERKLDVHLANLDLQEADPAGAALVQGALLTIAGAAAGGGRTGYWFGPERSTGKDGERVTLNPSGFSVSCVLPGVGATGLLAVPR